MKTNKKSILALILVVAFTLCIFAGCSKDESTNGADTGTKEEQTEKTDNKENVEKTQSDAPVLGEDVKLNSGEVVKKTDIQKEAEVYIPDSLPKEIKTVDDLMKYNDYVETLPDGREKELLLLKMQLFLEQIQ